ncbi:MAG: right-handed parallel beta-helix repeat-containing protein [Actinomycetota bacterium]|nr:right-handed parallel beta-helix repeat-containing protein [Actinomycetota bacterium]
MRAISRDGCGVLQLSVNSGRRWMALWTAGALAASALVMVGAGAGPAEAADYSCAGKPSTLTGTPQSDDLVGKSGRINVIQARGAGDIATGRDRADLVCGGKGADRLAGGGDADLVLGQSGADIMEGGTGDDVLIGQDGVDQANGGDGDDVCSAEVTDSLTCEQHAVAVSSFEQAIAAGEGATVVFMPGDYTGEYVQPGRSEAGTRTEWYASPGTRLLGELTSGQGSVLNGFEVYGGRVGVRCKPGAVCENLDVHHHSQAGVQIGGGSVDLTDSYVHENNLDLDPDPLHNDNPCFNSGGVHMVVGNNVTLTGNRLDNNGCDGVHSDTGMRYVTYEGNVATDNTRFGIFIEVSCDQTVTGNRIQRNGKDGVFIANSPRVVLTENTFGSNGGYAIRWKDYPNRSYKPSTADCDPKDKTGGSESGNTLNGETVTNAPTPTP